MSNQPTIEPVRDVHWKLRRAVEGLESIAGFAGQTLLGPDSKHHMGDIAPRYHEMGANAAFEQAASIARGYLEQIEDPKGEGEA